jgi:hypothetical protein
MASNEVRTMLGTTRATMAVSLPQIGKAALEEVIRGLGHDPSLIGIDDLQEIADRLSGLVKKDPPWGWRYLRNVLNGKLDPSRILVDAIMRLGAVIDDTPEEFARANQVSVLAIGKVKAGALILADSRRCANPGCLVEFVPRVPWQRCHSAECARVWRKVKKESPLPPSRRGTKPEGGKENGG